MGFWGTGPLDGDAPADWFAGLCALDDLDKSVREALSVDISQLSDREVQDAMAEMRAAAWIVERLGYNYVWPDEGEAQPTIVELAITQMEKIYRVLVDVEGAEGEWAVAVKRQIDGLLDGANESRTVRSYSPGLMQRLADHMEKEGA